MVTPDDRERSYPKTLRCVNILCLRVEFKRESGENPEQYPLL